VLPCAGPDPGDVLVGLVPCAVETAVSFVNGGVVAIAKGLDLVAVPARSAEGVAVPHPAASSA